jgi:hypothetical protein
LNHIKPICVSFFGMEVIPQAYASKGCTKTFYYIMKQKSYKIIHWSTQSHLLGDIVPLHLQAWWWGGHDQGHLPCSDLIFTHIIQTGGLTKPPNGEPGTQTGLVDPQHAPHVHTLEVIAGQGSTHLLFWVCRWRHHNARQRQHHARIYQHASITETPMCHAAKTHRLRWEGNMSLHLRILLFDRKRTLLLLHYIQPLHN